MACMGFVADRTALMYSPLELLAHISLVMAGLPYPIHRTQLLHPPSTRVPLCCLEGLFRSCVILRRSTNPLRASSVVRNSPLVP